MSDEDWYDDGKIFIVIVKDKPGESPLYLPLVMKDLKAADLVLQKNGKK